jgi:hypothetical protein
MRIARRLSEVERENGIVIADMGCTFLQAFLRAKIQVFARHESVLPARQAVARHCHLHDTPNALSAYEMRFAMPIRLKKFIGMILLVALVVIYSIVAVMVASAQLAQSHWLTHLAFFAFSGLLWVVPAMVIIKWMAGPMPEKE